MKFTNKTAVASLMFLLLMSSLVRADQSTDSGWFGGTVTDKKLGDTIGLRCTKMDSVADSEQGDKNKEVCSEVRVYRATLGRSDYLEPLSSPIRVLKLMNDTKHPDFDSDDSVDAYRLTRESYGKMFAYGGPFYSTGPILFLCGVGEVMVLWGPVTDTVLLPIQLVAYGVRRLHYGSVENQFQKNMLRIIIQKNINTPISHRHFEKFEESIQKLNETQANEAAAAAVK